MDQRRLVSIANLVQLLKRPETNPTVRSYEAGAAAHGCWLTPSARAIRLGSLQPPWQEPTDKGMPDLSGWRGIRQNAHSPRPRKEHAGPQSSMSLLSAGKHWQTQLKGQSRDNAASSVQQVQGSGSPAVETVSKADDRPPWDNSIYIDPTSRGNRPHRERKLGNQQGSTVAVSPQHTDRPPAGMPSSSSNAAPMQRGNAARQTAWADKGVQCDTSAAPGRSRQEGMPASHSHPWIPPGLHVVSSQEHERDKRDGNAGTSQVRQHQLIVHPNNLIVRRHGFHKGRCYTLTICPAC